MVITFVLIVAINRHRKLRRTAPSKDGVGTRGAGRILISFLQMTALAGEFRQAAPAALAQLLQAVATVGGDSVMALISAPLHCIYKLQGHELGHGVSVLLSLTLPIFLLGIATLCFVVIRACQGASISKHLTNDIVGTATVIWLLVFSRVTKIALSTFSFHTVDNTRYLQTDFSVVVGKGSSSSVISYTVMAALAIICLAVYTVGAPVLAFWSLRRYFAVLKVGATPIADRRYRIREDDGHTRLLQAPSLDLHSDASDWSLFATRRGAVSYGNNHNLVLLYRGYLPKAWWWEATVMLRKVLFAVISAFVQKASSQSALACLLLTLLISVQATVSPYADHRVNQAELIALLTLFVTRLGSLMFSIEDSPFYYVLGATARGPLALTIVLMAINSITFCGLFVMTLAGNKRVSALMRRCCDACRRSTRSGRPQPQPGSVFPISEHSDGVLHGAPPYEPPTQTARFPHESPSLTAHFPRPAAIRRGSGTAVIGDDSIELTHSVSTGLLYESRTSGVPRSFDDSTDNLVR